MTDKQIKVLMIEDNPGDILLIREMFKEVDISLFDLETASCLKEGLEKIEETLYDVILLDLGLPDSRGLETFIKVVKSIEDFWLTVVKLPPGESGGK